MQITGSLKDADKALFYLVNKKLSFTGLDDVMLLLRNQYTWIPLYLFFLLFFYFNCRKYLLPIVALSLVTFAITDFTSASLIKPFIQRLRPCHDPTLVFSINSLAGCGGIFGMPSSHASNHFGLATFWFMVIKNTVNQKWFWLWAWAFIICYAQVYVGVHFPGDVIVGALLGIATGYLTSHLFRKRMAQINSIKADI
ncbi:phosphatase PAP2 family protein [Segetibacter sp.]|jgi:membrane-associated phospholipid phosphatase|uniref:phosphatase PAP2 family protein n=1 Tax=Segetibacter sp. TaxID=2231182 RepID=UPI00262B1931|nr:phosphatase PAP2 family protein [Segetibacter sp.]MCW3080191.1 phosphoesterase PA-phosphatase related protein [Segetibacter sp.]